MKERKQPISQDTLQRKDRTESESYVGGQTFMGINENNLTSNYESAYGLLEQILSPTNLNLAYLQVMKNKGAGGIDKMEVESLKDYLVRNKETLLESISKGKYHPNPVRRVEIPKENGKKRPLGIPTVVDRVIQQAISQQLQSIYEPLFSDNSFGFRPNRGAHKALKRCQDYIMQGYVYAVQLDLERFFDTVNHSKLIEVLSKVIKDGRVVSLIHKYLNAGVMQNGRVEPTKEGVPQGGPLSPILSNILLNELDKELEKRGHKEVRYADDFVIFCKSQRAGERVMESISEFIEKRLFLKVNREKSKVAHIREITFLGYAFYTKDGGKGGLRLSPKAKEKIKSKIRELTSRSNGWGNERRKDALNQFIRGWVQYFKLADMKWYLIELDAWFRRRLRMVIWKQWKLTKTKYRNLVKLGFSNYKAWIWANSRKSYWRTANSKSLAIAISNIRLAQAGYVFFSDCYLKYRVVT